MYEIVIIIIIVALCRMSELRQSTRADGERNNALLSFTAAVGKQRASDSALSMQNLVPFQEPPLPSCFSFFVRHVSWLQLPMYADRHTLREKLLYAISANAGFELT